MSACCTLTSYTQTHTSLFCLNLIFNNLAFWLKIQEFYFLFTRFITSILLFLITLSVGQATGRASLKITYFDMHHLTFGICFIPSTSFFFPLSSSQSSKLISPIITTVTVITTTLFHSTQNLPFPEILPTFTDTVVFF